MHEDSIQGFRNMHDVHGLNGQCWTHMLLTCAIYTWSVQHNTLEN